MADQPLVDPGDLEGLPGAPFDEARVAEACDALRGEAGWHIAPEVTETLTLDCWGGPLLVLPTLALSKVSEIRDLTDPDDPAVLDGWRKSKAGLVERKAGWPAGLEVLELDIVHGYPQCPPELRPVIAGLIQTAKTSTVVKQESSSSESVTYDVRVAAMLRGDRRVQRYMVGVPAR